MEAFFKSSHAPNNTVIAIVGDIDPAATLNIVRQYFGSIPRRALNPSPITKEPPQRGERRINITSDANPAMIIGYHKPAMPEYDDMFLMCSNIFCPKEGHRGSIKLLSKTRCRKKYIHRQWHTGIKISNLFVIFAKPRHPHTSADVELSIYEEIEKMKTHAVSSRELEGENQLKADFYKKP